MARTRAVVSAVVSATALLVPLVLTGCGDGPDRFETYCSVVTKEQPGLGRLLEGAVGSSGLLPALPVFRRLEAASPDDIADDWSVVVQRLTSLSDALEAAGVDPSTYDPVKPPDGVTKAQQESISLAAGSLAAESVREALQNVEQQARDVCHTQLAVLR